MEVLDDIVVI